MSVTKLSDKQKIQSEDQSKSVIEAIEGVLMGTYNLTVTTQLAHWNAQGANFIAFHLLTEKQYGELFETVDILAERIRQLGRSVPLNSTGEFIVKGTLNNNDVRQATKQLIELHEASSEKAKAAAELADEAGDIGTNDILVDCVKFHDKAAWMLRASLSAG